MTYPKLWPVGGHPEGEAKVRQLKKLGPKWLRASGPGWVAEKQNKLSNVKHGGEAEFYTYGWGRRRNPDAEGGDRYWNWGGDPLYDEFWVERTRWSSGAAGDFAPGPHSPGEYVGYGYACDVQSTAQLDEYGNDASVFYESKLSEAIDYIFNPIVQGLPITEKVWGVSLDEPHSTNISLHRVGAVRGAGVEVSDFTPVFTGPLGKGKAIVIGYSAAFGASCEDLVGEPTLNNPSYCIVERIEGSVAVGPVLPIPLTGLQNSEVGRNWSDMRAVVVGPGKVCVVMQSDRREPFTFDTALDVREHVLVAFYQEPGAWSGYTLTDAIGIANGDPLRIGINFYADDLHGKNSLGDTQAEQEAHPAYGRVIYAFPGDQQTSTRFYIMGFCALPPVENGGDLECAAFLVSNSCAFRLTQAGHTKILSLAAGEWPIWNLRAFSDGAVVGYQIAGFAGPAGQNLLLRRYVSADAGATWASSLFYNVAGLPANVNPASFTWGAITPISETTVVATISTFPNSLPGTGVVFLRVVSKDRGETWAVAGAVTPDTPEWVSAAGPVDNAGLDRAFMFHRLRPSAIDPTYGNGRYRWLGAQFGKIHYCGRPGRWAPYDAAIPDLLKEVP